MSAPTSRTNRDSQLTGVRASWGAQPRGPSRYTDGHWADEGVRAFFIVFFITFLICLFRDTHTLFFSLFFRSLVSFYIAHIYIYIVLLQPRAKQWGGEPSSGPRSSSAPHALWLKAMLLVSCSTIVAPHRHQMPQSPKVMPRSTSRLSGPRLANTFWRQRTLHRQWHPCECSASNSRCQLTSCNAHRVFLSFLAVAPDYIHALAELASQHKDSWYDYMRDDLRGICFTKTGEAPDPNNFLQQHDPSQVICHHHFSGSTPTGQLKYP